MTNLPAPAHPGLAGHPPIDVLRLIRTLNVGSITFFQLIRRFGSAARALEALPDLSLRGGRKQALKPCNIRIAEDEMAKIERYGARVVLYGEADYPVWLMTINDPPPLITVLGHPSVWARPSLAMVGARNASANGCALAQKFARELGEHGVTTVSGLARGVDTFAHRGALATGTVAVIAGGIDNIYPPENKDLYRQIADTGAIISEQPFGMAPFSTSFPSRNRIIAGMTLATLVVEAAPKSGSLITARNALDYHREVFAVPGSPLDPRAKGCNQLIKQGALMVESTADIMEGLAHLQQRKLSETPEAEFAHLPESTPDADELAAARMEITEKLGATPVGVDELLTQCQVSPGALLTVLLELELAGKLERLPGNKVALVLQEELELSA